MDKKVKNKNKEIVEEYKEKIAVKEKDETIVHSESLKYNRLQKHNQLHRMNKLTYSLIKIGTISYLISGLRCGTGAEGITFEKGAVSSTVLNEWNRELGGKNNSQFTCSDDSKIIRIA